MVVVLWLKWRLIWEPTKKVIATSMDHPLFQDIKLFKGLIHTCAPVKNYKLAFIIPVLQYTVPYVDQNIFRTWSKVPVVKSDYCKGAKMMMSVGRYLNTQGICTINLNTTAALSRTGFVYRQAQISRRDWI